MSYTLCPTVREKTIKILSIYPSISQRLDRLRSVQSLVGKDDSVMNRHYDPPQQHHPLCIESDSPLELSITYIPHLSSFFPPLLHPFHTVQFGSITSDSGHLPATSDVEVKWIQRSEKSIEKGEYILDRDEANSVRNQPG